MSFANIVKGAEGDQWRTTSYQQYDLSTVMEFIDGRRFRYAQNNASAAAVAGDVQSSTPLVSDNILRTAAAALAGARSVSLTIGGTDIAADAYRDGFFAQELVAGSGRGYIYQVDTHPAETGTTFVVPLKGTLQTAISTTASSCTLVHNPRKWTIVAPTTETGTLAGVACKPLAASYFGWLQTKGPAAVTCVGTVVNGEPVSVITTAGAAGPWAAVTTNPIGKAMHTGTATGAALIDLDID